MSDRGTRADQVWCKPIPPCGAAGCDAPNQRCARCLRWRAFKLRATAEDVSDRKLAADMIERATALEARANELEVLL